jgi:hypothetical protein
VNHIQHMLLARDKYLEAYHQFLSLDKKNELMQVYTEALDKLSLNELMDFYPTQNKIISDSFKLDECTLLLDSYNDSAISGYLIKRGVSLFKPFDHVAFMSFILFLAPNDYFAGELRKTFHQALSQNENIFFYSTENLPQELEVLTQSEYKELGYNLIIDSIKNGGDTLHLMNAIYKNKNLTQHLDQSLLLDIYFSYNLSVKHRELALLDFTLATKPEGFGENFLTKMFEKALLDKPYERGSLYSFYRDKYFSAEDFLKVSQKNPEFLNLFTQPLNNLDLTHDYYEVTFDMIGALMLSSMEAQLGQFTSVDLESVAFKILDSELHISNKHLGQEILNNTNLLKDNIKKKNTLKI